MPLINTWLYKPKHNHVVNFYSYDFELINNLSIYINEGLKANETVIVVATPAHLQKVRQRIGSRYGDALENGQLIEYDAVQTLPHLLTDNAVDVIKFQAVATPLLRKILARGAPARMYGEMVVLLWKQGHPEAVKKLEKLWDELMEEHQVSVLCSYPLIYFDARDHKNDIYEICDGHAEVVGQLSPAYA